MNRAEVDRIADAILYEGYILYPYRPSLKNRQRWTFGGLYPEGYCRARADGSAASNQTECLVRGIPDSVFDARVRFLQLTERQVAEVESPMTAWPDDVEPPLRRVPSIRVGGQLYHEWQEAEPRAFSLGAVSLGELLTQPRKTVFTLPGGRRLEPLRDPAARIAGALVREQATLEGVIEAEAAGVADGLYRLTLRVTNCTTIRDVETSDRDEAVLRSLASTHALLAVEAGAFVSLVDPPESCRGAAAACRNVGLFPVLVGDEGSRDAMLSAPIILYDYPRVAPESPGEFFDGTEIDEMLTLRIITLTDDEKDAMAAVDGRARALLARTERSARDQLLALHGTLRDHRPAPGERDR
jgi:hydrogenase maturation protease